MTHQKHKAYLGCCRTCGPLDAPNTLTVIDDRMLAHRKTSPTHKVYYLPIKPNTQILTDKDPK